MLVLPDGTAGFADVFVNTGPANVTIDVDLASSLVDPVDILVPATSTGGTYQVTGVRGSADHGVLAQVFASAAPAAMRPSLIALQTLGGVSTVRYRITIPAGQRRTLVHFVVNLAAGQAAAAIARAEQVRSASDPAIAAWLESLDPATIVNSPSGGGGQP